MWQKKVSLLTVLSTLFILFTFLFTLLLVNPSQSLAAGLVPCGGPGEDPCQTCHVIELTNNVFNWAAINLGILFVILIVVLGLYLVTASGSDAKTKVRRLISNIIVGYMIFLGVWFIVSFFLRLMADDETYGMWDKIQCVEQPDVQEYSRIPASTGVDADGNPIPLKSYGSSGEVDGAVKAITNDKESIKPAVEEAASAYGMSEQEAKAFRGLVYQESSDCANREGPATNVGKAYGCTQMLVSTARQMDPNLRDLTDAQVAEKLKNDNGYSISIGAKYYKSLLDKYEGDDPQTQINKALAAYNGGPGANGPSRDCPGLEKWQCEWDSPGCYNTGKTDCKRNQGFSSYEQTRNYVSNINKIADKL